MPSGYPSAPSNLPMKAFITSSADGLAARLCGAFTDQSMEARSVGAASALDANRKDKGRNGIGNTFFRMLNSPNQGVGHVVEVGGVNQENTSGSPAGKPIAQLTGTTWWQNLVDARRETAIL